MNEGKLPPAVLERLLRAHRRRRSGRAGGRGDRRGRGRGARRPALVLTADPITFTEENIGLYAVAVNCNDVVAMGGRPRYLITTLLLPPRFPASRLSADLPGNPGRRRDRRGAVGRRAHGGDLGRDAGGDLGPGHRLPAAFPSADFRGPARAGAGDDQVGRPGGLHPDRPGKAGGGPPPAGRRRLPRGVWAGSPPRASASCPRAGSWSASASPPVTTPPKAASPPASMRSPRAPAWASCLRERGHPRAPAHPGHLPALRPGPPGRPELRGVPVHRRPRGSPAGLRRARPPGHPRRDDRGDHRRLPKRCASSARAACAP